MKIRLATLLVVLLGLYQVTFPGLVAASDVALYSAYSKDEMESLIFAAIKNREMSFQIKYLGDTSDIMNNVSLARDGAVKKDPYEEGTISLISGFKVSKFDDHADITFEGFQYYTTKDQELYVNQEVQRIVSQVTNLNMSEQAKVKAVHDYIVQHVEYDQTLAGYTAYSALKNGVTVCNGYVQLMYRLLVEAGVEVKIVKGSTNAGGLTRDHAWNLVKISGKWYHLDVTLNKTMGNLQKYYNVTDTALAVDHQWDRSAYPVADTVYSTNSEITGNTGGGNTSVSDTLVNETVQGGIVLAIVDAAKLNELIATIPSNHKVLEFVVQKQGGTIKLELPAQSVKLLASRYPLSLIKLKTTEGYFEFPLKSLDLEQYSKELNSSIDQLKLNLIITSVDSNTKNVINKQVSMLNATALNNPLEFSAQVSNTDGAVKEINTANTYITKTVFLANPLPDGNLVGLSYNRLTNTLTPIPAFLSNINAKPVVVLKHRGNGTYILARAEKNFSDLKGHWAEKEIKQLASKLVVNGRKQTVFDPQGQVTRAEFAALLIRALGITPTDSSIQFKDINNQWFSSTVKTAAEIGLVNGFSDGSFRPQSTISRAEMAVMVERAMGLVETSVAVTDVDRAVASFGDKKNIQPWSKASVAKVAKAGIIKGNAAGNFDPDKKANRGEAVVMLMRLLKYASFAN